VQAFLMYSDYFYGLQARRESEHRFEYRIDVLTFAKGRNGIGESG